MAPDTQLPTIAVAPTLSNPRMTAQQSAFMLCGDSFGPLEVIHDSLITKIALPPNSYDDAQRYLELSGVGPFTYFPDLEGLRNELLNRIKADVTLAKKHMGKD